MSDKLDDLKVSADYFCPKLDEKTRQAFLEKVKGMLDYSPKAKSRILPLLKDEKTFSNSVADIYLYLQDQKICSMCTKGLKTCPKKACGYYLCPRYDEDINAIVMDNIPCEYLKAKNRSLDLIFPCDIPSDSIYASSSKLLTQIQSRKSKNEWKDTENMVYEIVSRQRNYSKDKMNQGLVFFSIHGEEIARRLLMFAAYAFASKGIKVSYVKLDSLFFCFKDKDYQVVEMAQSDYRRLLSVPVLCLEHINQFERRFYSEEFLVRYLYPLILARNKAGMITFASLSQDKTIDALGNSWFYRMDQKAEVIDAMESMFEKKKIKDLILA